MLFVKQLKRLNKAELFVAGIYQITTEYRIRAREIHPLLP